MRSAAELLKAVLRIARGTTVRRYRLIHPMAEMVKKYIQRSTMRVYRQNVQVSIHYLRINLQRLPKNAKKGFVPTHRSASNGSKVGRLLPHSSYKLQ